MEQRTRNRRIMDLTEGFRECAIILYGAGKRGKVALENLCSLGMGDRIKGFLDDNCNSDREYCGRRLYSPAQLQDADSKDTVYIITTYSVNAMVRRLTENGIPADRIYFLPELLVDDYAMDFFRNHKSEIEQVYHMLEDGLSKYIYKSIYEVYVNGHIGSFSRTKGEVQYFPVEGAGDAVEGFHLSGNEAFVDCGAYDGDTIRCFKDKVKDQYKKIWAFEPDIRNFEKLSKYVEQEQDKRIKIYRGGIQKKYPYGF